MHLIKPSFNIENDVNGLNMLKAIEKAGRTCYKSEANISDESAIKFVQMIIKRGHESVLEHEKITVRVICDRGVSHEIVRHRIASYSQESTRYCNYSSNGLTFIIPSWLDIEEEEIEDYDSLLLHGYNPAGMWKLAMAQIEMAYLELLEKGWTPQQARSVLPNSLKTEIVMTMNLREWRWFFIKRADKYSHPQMQEIANPMLKEFKRLIPIIFDDLKGSDE